MGSLQTRVSEITIGLHTPRTDLLVVITLNSEASFSEPRRRLIIPCFPMVSYMRVWAMKSLLTTEERVAPTIRKKKNSCVSVSDTDI